MSIKENTKNYLNGKTILVLGGAGSIGSALCRTIAEANPEQLIILDQDETGVFDLYEDLKGKCNVDYVIANIRDAQWMFDVFAEYKPQIVFQAAALKHVSLMEKYPQEAEKTNIQGMRNIINAAKYVKSEKFVFISTDKAVNPKCVMGKSKLAGEEMCLSEDSFTKFMVVRFGNVMASRGSLIPIWQKQISEGKNLTVTHKDMKRYFLGIYEAVGLVLEAARLGEGGEKFILDMGEPMYINELAKMMIKLSGKPLEVEYTEPKEGEKFSEELMTEDEKKRAVKQGNLYIIKP